MGLRVVKIISSTKQQNINKSWFIPRFLQVGTSLLHHFFSFDTHLFLLATDFRNRLQLSDNKEQNWRFSQIFAQPTYAYFYTDIPFNIYVASYLNNHVVRAVIYGNDFSHKTSI